MLHNVKLLAGIWNEIGKQGKHINVVLAAGQISARIRNKAGNVYETNLISGMAFPTSEDFVSVSFKSDTDQQCIIWLSFLPLDYSPDTSREVGSSALQSFVAEAYSGSAQLLLDAQSGRNKVTISPAADILIGGVNLNLKNGIPVAGGSVFEFATQGAVYALETTGAYPPTISTEAQLADVASPTSIARPLSQRNFVSYDEGGEYWMNNGASSWTRYNADTNAVIGTISAPAPLNEATWRARGKQCFVALVSSQFRYYEIDTDTQAVTHEDIGAGNVGGFGAEFNDKRYAFDSTNDVLYVSDNLGAWVAGATPAPVGAETPKGMAVNSQGDVFVITSAGIYRTVDEGANWTSVVLPVGVAVVTRSAIACDRTADLLYYINSGNLVMQSSDNGTTWQAVNGDTSTDLGSNAYHLDVVGRTLLAASPDVFVYHNPEVGTATFALNGTQPLGVHIGDDGRLYTGDQSTVYFVEGQKVLTGGLEVAIMAEVN